MSKKLSLSGQSRKTVEEVFNDFVISQTAQGLSETTIATYRCHIHSISKHLDIQKPMNTLTKGDLEAMVVSMRRSGLAHNSISSYCRVLRTFLNWSKRNDNGKPVQIRSFPSFGNRKMNNMNSDTIEIGAD